MLQSLFKAALDPQRVQKSLQHARLQHFCNSSQSEREWPVIIAGAGPSGLTLSTLLSQQGIPNLVLERASTLTEHPQAHFINCRTMEVFRQMPDGISNGNTLADRVNMASPPLDHWRKFIYCQSMTGSIFGEVDHFKGQVSPKQPEISPEGVAHLSQSKLLPMLLDCARSYHSTADIRFDHKVTSVKTFGGHVNVRAEGLEGQQVLRCKYLVAADGASSLTRAQLGIRMQGQAAMQHLVNIHFSAPRLGRAMREKRPAMLYFVFNPKAVVVVVAHDLDDGEFVAQVPYYPPVQHVQDFTEAHCRELIATASGVEDPSFKVKTIRSWRMSAQVALRFQAGRVFLVGDAAHQFPPAGGFGMNTGIQDAHNLAWKLAEALRSSDREQTTWLNSYEAERKPVAIANTELSVANFAEAMRVPKALGLDPAAAELLSSASSAVFSLLPGLGKRVLTAGMALGLAASGVDGPLRSWRKQTLQGIFQAGASLRLQFPREDLGFRYDKPGAAVIPELPNSADGQPVANTLLKPDRDTPYEPSTAPGCRLPHLELQGDGSKGSRSLLDFVGPSSWLLICRNPESSWLEAGRMLIGEKQDLVVLCIVCGNNEIEKALEDVEKTIDSLVDVASGRAHDSSGPRSHTPPRLNVVAMAKEKGNVLGISDHDGALLIRPDGHVAWRHQGYTDQALGTDAAYNQVKAILGRLRPCKGSEEARS